MTILLWLLMGLVSLFFLFAGTVKATGRPKKISDYQHETYSKKFGVSKNQMRMIGIAEICGAIGLWLQPSILGLLAISGLILVTLGAIFFHMRFSKLGEALPAIIMLVLSTILLITALQA